MGQRSKAPINAIDGFSEPLDRLRAALDASCVVGTWDWDIVRSTMVYDTGAARLLTGDPSRAETEISGPETLAAVHPDDHDWLLDHVQRTVRAGGLVLAEYRVVAADGTVRWLLSRGRTFQNAIGHPVRARGIIIDITEMREGEDRYVFSGEAAVGNPLERATDLAIALKRTLGDDAAAEVRIATDMLLMSLGRAIARDHGSH
ncbi:PAS domain-containing protein [Methylobacterium mesophilicum SR1.6/6]|uniref:histidine kinase n=1 Tax=Methylobacterium mesophilicum SR1.6/6 TaxID=908290 RepID=A0A6B9FRT8_9HYPH|nr:PAS domain-containing protein [Methylobacterium mesophilicum]QGY03675.1 PAS domain-containing protein [Methylobacterium mesophilicum SR1.6/6]